MWLTPAATASRMNSTFLGVFVSRLVPRPILPTSTLPTRSVLVTVVPPMSTTRPHRSGQKPPSTSTRCTAAAAPKIDRLLTTVVAHTRKSTGVSITQALRASSAAGEIRLGHALQVVRSSFPVAVRGISSRTTISSGAL